MSRAIRRAGEKARPRLYLRSAFPCAFTVISPGFRGPPPPSRNTTERPSPRADGSVALNADGVSFTRRAYNSTSSVGVNTVGVVTGGGSGGSGGGCYRRKRLGPLSLPSNGAAEPHSRFHESAQRTRIIVRARDFCLRRKGPSPPRIRARREGKLYQKPGETRIEV